jgi:hypothetical protein
MIECLVHPEEKVCHRECDGTSYLSELKKKNIMNVMDITPKSYFGTCGFPKILRMILNTRQSFPTDAVLWAVVGLNIGIF